MSDDLTRPTGSERARRTLATYRDYADAQRTVDTFSDRGFPVDADVADRASALLEEMDRPAVHPA